MSQEHALPRSVDRHRAEDAGTASSRMDDRELVSGVAWRRDARRGHHGVRNEMTGPKEAISIRIDRDVLEWFRTNSDHYQTRINALLRAFVDEAKNRNGVG